MYFDFAAFFRTNYKAFFKAKGTNYRLTPKRFAVLFVWLLLYIPAQVINRVFFLIDELVFPKYREQEIIEPLFIIGNPRSGTTFLHRLLELDKERYNSFLTWEMIFAPSVTQRKLIGGIAAMLKWIGVPLQRLLRRVSRQISVDEKAHPIRLNSSEEDDHILMHAWASATIWGFYPIPEELLPYYFFDRDLPLEKQDQIMRFYKNMVQRQLYAHGGKLRLLSKNPAFTPKLASLLRHFPDAKFINLARNPFETLPSMLNYMSTGWKLFADPIEEHPYLQDIVSVLSYYYRYPLHFFADKPDTCLFMKYEDLVREPEESIHSIYEWLGYEISPAYAERLTLQFSKARAYRSQHHYDLAGVGLTEEEVLETLGDVFAHYEFDSLDYGLPERKFWGGLGMLRKRWKEQREARRRRKEERHANRDLHVSVKK
jgi:hypothetical protein